MRICSNEPCIVLLTEKDTWLRVNGKEPISLKANHMAILACENNVIDISSLNSVLVIQVSRNNIKDYLQFLNKDLSHLPVWQRNADPLLTANCLPPREPRQPAAAQKETIAPAVSPSAIRAASPKGDADTRSAALGIIPIIAVVEST